MSQTPQVRRTIQDHLALAKEHLDAATEKLRRRTEATIQTPPALVREVREAELRLKQAIKTLQTPKKDLELDYLRLEEVRKELRQMARLASRPETDTRNFHNALVVMAALAIQGNAEVTLEEPEPGKAYLILHLPTGQISFTASGGGEHRLWEALGMSPNPISTWDGHTSQERTLRVNALAASVRPTIRLAEDLDYGFLDEDQGSNT